MGNNTAYLAYQTLILYKIINSQFDSSAREGHTLGKQQGRVMQFSHVREDSDSPTSEGAVPTC